MLDEKEFSDLYWMNVKRMMENAERGDRSDDSSDEENRRRGRDSDYEWEDPRDQMNDGMPNAMDVFNNFAGENEKMSYEQFGDGFRSLEGGEVDEDRIKEAWEMCDQNSNGKLGKQEFRDCYWQYRHDRMMRGYWSRYSEDNYINMANFSMGYKESDPDAKFEDIERMYYEADRNGDGNLDEKEFQELYW
jgi:Ca2+-binding EF-hand superfamily protein